MSFQIVITNVVISNVVIATINGKRVVVCEWMKMRQHRGGGGRLAVEVLVFVVWLSFTNTNTKQACLGPYIGDSPP